MNSDITVNIPTSLDISLSLDITLTFDIPVRPDISDNLVISIYTNIPVGPFIVSFDIHVRIDVMVFRITHQVIFGQKSLAWSYFRSISG